MAGQSVAALAEIADQDDDPRRIVDRVAPLARAMAADTDWVEPAFYEADKDQGFGVTVLHADLDDGTKPGHADVEVDAELRLERGHVVALLPDDIHSVRNDGERTSLSLHIYGRNLAEVERSEFDPLAKTVRPCPPRQRNRAD